MGLFDSFARFCSAHDSSEVGRTLRLVLLGGAKLAGALLQADLVDELQLTLCPLLLGGAFHWLPAAARPQPQRWHLLETQPLGEDELLLRYQRSENA